jgi:hypothetical protein
MRASWDQVKALCGDRTRGQAAGRGILSRSRGVLNNNDDLSTPTAFMIF